jgi:hypothetical protein
MAVVGVLMMLLDMYDKVAVLMMALIIVKDHQANFCTS